MKGIVFILALLVAACAAMAWVLSAPKPRYAEAEWQALGLAGARPGTAGSVCMNAMRSATSFGFIR